jgi:preprotein translocase subunit SecE
MSHQQVETVVSGADRTKLGAAGALLLASLVVYYLLAKQGPYVQWAALIVLVIAAVALFFSSERGKALVGYGQESARELRKVVWPTRKEATQMTVYVFGFVVVMSMFLWLTDKTLEWLLYDLVLGWKR